MDSIHNTRIVISRNNEKAGIDGIFRFSRVSSTMDEARKLVIDQDFICVLAEVQVSGRGTRGRSWLSLPGNGSMTIAIRRELLSPAGLRLLPIQTGLTAAEVILSYLPEDARKKLRLKWPNDILMENRKVCGILIEQDTLYCYLGIGINFSSAPEITDGGRESASLHHYGMDMTVRDTLMESLFLEIRNRTLTPRQNSEILSKWRALIDWTQKERFRGRQNEEVTPLEVNEHGALLVRLQDGGQTWLSCDYLY